MVKAHFTQDSHARPSWFFFNHPPSNKVRSVFARFSAIIFASYDFLVTLRALNELYSTTHRPTGILPRQLLLFLVVDFFTTVQHFVAVAFITTLSI